MHILDRLFPFMMDNWFGNGFRPEVARRYKTCHVQTMLPYGNHCIANECMAWSWTRSKNPFKGGWRAIFTLRRGVCSHSQRRR